MSRTTRLTSGCDAIQGDLVEFADLTLDETKAAQVRQHVDICPICRQEVAALRRSLSIAQSIWVARAESKLDPPSEFEELRRQRLTRHFSLANAVIVSAVLSVAVLVGWNATRPSVGPEAIVQNVRSPQDVDEPDANPVVDIETYLQREEQAARLAATIEILVDMPTAVEDVAKAKRYLHVHYGVAVSDGAIRN